MAEATPGPVRPVASPRVLAGVDELPDLGDRPVEVVVDDDVAAERPGDLASRGRFGEARRATSSAGSPRPRSRWRWRLGIGCLDEEQQGVGRRAAHLLGAVDVDLEQHVVAGGGSGIGVP